MAQPKMKNQTLSLILALIALAKAGAEPVRTSRVSPVCELIDTNLISILLRDDSPALNAQLEKGLSPNKEYGGTGCMPEELSLPLLRYAITFKAESCVRHLLDRGASVTRPDAFNKIAIQWAEEEGTPRIADMVERANMDTNLVSGLEITNVIMRLFPPVRLSFRPPTFPWWWFSTRERTSGENGKQSPAPSPGRTITVCCASRRIAHSPSSNTK